MSGPTGRRSCDVVIGVDPGLSGALAVVSPDVVSVHDMPVAGKHVNGRILADLFATHRDTAVVVIEDVHAMPTNGSIGSFSLGRSKGLVEGIAAALELPCTYVAPQRWKRDLRLSKDKGESRRRASDLYPEIAHALSRVKDDGRAEALLIAHWYLTYGDS